MNKIFISYAEHDKKSLNDIRSMLDNPNNNLHGIPIYSKEDKRGEGKEAVDKYDELKPDLVTMDIVMPKVGDIDGIGAVKQIMGKDDKAKILMVSAMGQHALVVEAIQAGAKDFVTKPFQPSRVIEAAKRVIES